MYIFNGRNFNKKYREVLNSLYFNLMEIYVIEFEKGNVPMMTAQLKNFKDNLEDLE